MAGRGAPLTGTWKTSGREQCPARWQADLAARMTEWCAPEVGSVSSPSGAGVAISPRGSMIMLPP